MDTTNTAPTIFRDVPLPATRTLPDKLLGIRLPEQLDFHGTRFYDALSFLRQVGCEGDVEEADPLSRGVPVWIGVVAGTPGLLGEPGESATLDRWIGKVRFTASFPVGTSLDSAWQRLAESFGLELRVHEAENLVVLHLPGAASGKRFASAPLARLKAATERARATLRQRGW